MVGANSYKLTRAQNKLLNQAGDWVIDLMVADAAAFEAGGTWGQLWVEAELPERFVRHYDLAFMKRFLDTVIVVCWKVRDRRWWAPNPFGADL